MRQHITRVGGSSWINRYISFIDVLNDPILVYYKCSTIAEALFFVEDSVIFHHGSFEIAEQWKCDADVLRKAAVGGNAVDADSKNLSICSFEFGDISLIRLQLLRSTTGKSEYIEGKYYIFLSFEIAEFYLLSGRAWKSEVRRSITNFQVRLGWGWLLCADDHSESK
jgi:hypothetical protein